MTAAAYLYICDGDIDHPVLTHKKMDWPEKYPHWQEIPLVMAQPAQQKPVAWVHLESWKTGKFWPDDCFSGLPVDEWQPLYTTPLQRTWVGLMRGVRVEGDTVVITVKGGNEAARELCGALIEEMSK